MTTYSPLSFPASGDDPRLTIPAVDGLSVSFASYRGPFVTATLTFQDVALPLVDEAGVVAYGGLKIADMPEGAYAVLGAVSALAVTKSSAGVNADADGDFGIGTVTASNNGTLASTEQNIVPTTALPQMVSGATTAKGVSTAATYLDGTTTPSDIFFNALIDDADHNVTGTACDLILNGTVTLHYAYLGNH